MTQGYGAKWPANATPSDLCRTGERLLDRHGVIRIVQRDAVQALAGLKNLSRSPIVECTGEASA